MRQPEILLSSQYGKQVWNDECDCACPMFDVVDLTSQVHNEQEFFCQSDIFISELTKDIKLLFNPIFGQDVAVLNQTAYQIWEQFTVPKQLLVLDHPDRKVAREMVQLGLLEPASGLNHPCHSELDALSVWLHVTNTCNLNCSYCYVHKSNEHMSLETGVAAVDAVFRSALQGGFQKIMLKFSGGEPTLQLDLVLQLHAYALAKAAREGLELNGVILSNGVSLDQHDLAEIQARGLRLMLSLDGFGHTHDIQRPLVGGAGSFRGVWRSMEHAIDVGLTPFISITITERNARGLPDLIHRLLKLGLPFNLNFARPMSNGFSFSNSIITSTLLEAFQCIEADLPEYSLLGSLLDRAFISYSHERPCGVGESYLVIDHRGQIAQCHMLLGENITDIHAEDPLSIIQRTGSVRNPSVDQKEGCQRCQWRYLCAGGCPLTAYHASGRYDVSSPYCEIYQALFPEVLRLEGMRIMKYSGSELAA